MEDRCCCVSLVLAVVARERGESLCWLLDSSVGIRGAPQADVKSHPAFPGLSPATARREGKNGHQQRVFSIRFCPRDNLGYAVHNPLEVWLAERNQLRNVSSDRRRESSRGAGRPEPDWR